MPRTVNQYGRLNPYRRRPPTQRQAARGNIVNLINLLRGVFDKWTFALGTTPTKQDAHFIPTDDPTAPHPRSQAEADFGG